jgi:hypothetical protein
VGVQCEDGNLVVLVVGLAVGPNQSKSTLPLFQQEAASGQASAVVQVEDLEIEAEEGDSEVVVEGVVSEGVGSEVTEEDSADKAEAMAEEVTLGVGEVVDSEADEMISEEGTGSYLGPIK